MTELTNDNQTDEIESTTIEGAIKEIEYMGIIGDIAEAIATHIIMTDTDYVGATNER